MCVLTSEYYFDFAQFNIRLFLSQGLNMCQFAFTSAWVSRWWSSAITNKFHWKRLKIQPCDNQWRQTKDEVLSDTSENIHKDGSLCVCGTFVAQKRLESLKQPTRTASAT